MPGPLVLHVLPIDLARGAQTYGRELRDALDGPAVQHRSLALFSAGTAASGASTLRPDWSLAVADGAARRLGVDPRVVTRFRRLLRREAPAIVVAHGSEPLKYAVLAGVAPEQLVYYKIGIGGTRLGGFNGRFHRFLLGRVAVAATVSDDAAAELRALGVTGARLRVIPNGRDAAAYAPRGAVARPDGTGVRLVFVGHLTESKRPARFIDLVVALRAAGLSVAGTMAGDGPLLGDLRAAGADHAVEVLGRIDDVPKLLAESDVFVFTSAPEGEGMPGVLIEAGLAGLPVVTTDVAGARAVVVDGESGFVVPVDDFDALTGAVRTLVVDPAQRARFGAAARALCEERFSLTASVAVWRDLLAEMMAGRCASST